MKYKIIQSIVVVFVLAFTSCKKDVEVESEPKKSPSPTATIEFLAHVKPIFDNNCNNGYCHGTGADGKYFTSHAKVILVSPDTLLGAINHTPGFDFMPRSSSVKLRQGLIDTITQWVNEGRPNN